MIKAINGEKVLADSLAHYEADLRDDIKRGRIREKHFDAIMATAKSCSGPAQAIDCVVCGSRVTSFIDFGFVNGGFDDDGDVRIRIRMCSQCIEKAHSLLVEL